MRHLRSVFVLLLALGAGTGLFVAVAFGEGEVQVTRAIGDSLQGVAAESGGNAVVVGRSGTSMLIRRVAADGTFSTTFAGGAGTARAAAVQSDGKIVVVGDDDSGVLVRRYLASGALDATFGSAGTTRLAASTGLAVAIAPCGDIVVGGGTKLGDGFPRVALARLGSSGIPDPSFGNNGVKVLDYGKNSQANGVAIQPDGKVVFGGQQAPGLQVTGALIGRVNTNGESDQGFGQGGTYYYDAKGGVNARLNGVAVDTAGRIVGVGSDIQPGGALGIFVRLNSNGSLDGSFGSGGVYNPTTSGGASNEPTGPRSVFLLTNGRIVGFGSSSNGLRLATLFVVTSNGQAENSVPGGGRITTPPGSSGGDGLAASIAPNGTIYGVGDTREFSAPVTGFVTTFASVGTPVAAAACSTPAPAPTPTTPAPTPTTPAPTPTTPAPTPTTDTTPATVPTPTPTPTLLVSPRATQLTLRDQAITRRTGTALTYTMSRRATVFLTLEQRRSGRRGPDSRCFKAASTNRGGRRCTYYVRLPGSKRVTGRPGVNRVKITTTISTRKLAPGAYRLRVRVVQGNTRLFTLKVDATAARRR